METTGGESLFVSEMRVRNFRNFRTARFRFCEGVNTLVGENGSGKTNAFHALRLLLDDGLSRNAIQLRDSDFCRAIGSWKGHWIVVAIDFQELDSSEGCQLLKHATGHMNGEERGTFALLYRPKIAVRRKLYEMTQQDAGSEAFETFLDSVTVEDYEVLTTGRSEADFTDNAVYSQVVGDFDGFMFPDPDNEDAAVIGTRMGSIYQEVSCTYAPALRDVVADLRSYRSSPLLALLRGTQIQAEEAKKISGTVDQLNKDISSLPEVCSIADGIQTTLLRTVGSTYSPGIGIESALPNDMERLLQRLVVKVGDDAGTAYRGEIWEQSLGGANHVYLALKLLEYEMKLSSDRVAHFLLIEEPEAHLHTHVQKTLFENQPTSRTQVIVSTHSTHISSVARIEAVNVLGRQGDIAEVFQPWTGMSKSEIQRLERYLDAVRTTILFAKGVMLVEGTAELVLIPALFKAVFGVSPDEMGISVISLDCAFFEHVARIFSDQRMRRRCSIVTDGDLSVIDLPADEKDDDKAQAKARASQVAGERRAARLVEVFDDSVWVGSFVSKHTLEVDFLEAGNEQAFVAILPELYESTAHIEKSKTELTSGDLKRSGIEALRLAEKVGKGWLALLMAERISPDARIPTHIIQGLAHILSPSFTSATAKRMGLYRLGASDALRAELADKVNLEALAEMSDSDFMAAYVEAAADDDLTRLIQAVG